MTTACLIGISGFGEVHYTDLMRQIGRGTMRLLGATVINQPDEPVKCERLRAIGCELFTDHRAMLDRFGAETDICFIPAGIHLHAPMTMDALRSGANVFVEKPAAATIQDVHAMERCERETGRFAAVGYQSMYAREATWMKRAILEGKIGTLRAIKCRGLWTRADSYYSRNGWAGHLRVNESWILDSPFNNAFSHQLNMICFLAGTEMEHSANLLSIEAELYRARAIESPDTACLRITTREQLPLYFFVTHCPEQDFGPELIVRGDRGVIRWNQHSAAIETGESREEMPCETGEELRDSILDRLRRRVTDPSVFVCSPGIAGTQTLCANGAHDSSPVREIDSRFALRLPHKDSMKTVIRGIDAVFDDAFQNEKLFSETGVEWAHRGRMIPLTNYDWFPGGTRVE